MLYYRAIKPIRKGDQLLAWYSPSVELELYKALLTIQSNEDLKSLNGILEATTGKIIQLLRKKILEILIIISL